MFRIYLKISLLFILLIFSFHILNTDTKSQDLDHPKEMNMQKFSKELKADLDYGSLPLYFIPNKSQVQKKALFYSRTPCYTLWITQEGLVFDAIKKIKKGDSEFQLQDPENRYDPQAYKYRRDISRLIFIDANNKVKVTPLDITDHRVNYFVRGDKSREHTGIRTSRAVLYRDIYKGIDLKIYGNERDIEYDWIVKPGGEPDKVKFEYRDVMGTRIDKEGNLVVKTEFGELAHKKPVSYQIIKEEKVEVEVNFENRGGNTYCFEIKEYDKDYKLYIDPVVLTYSTYLGGDYPDYGYGIVVDSDGNAYITGMTQSSDFPLKNHYQNDKIYGDAFVTKLSSTGDSLVYSTYLGGSDRDIGHDIAVDSLGHAYIIGSTKSIDFPTSNAFQDTFQGGSYDAFVTKLSSTGDSLVYSTYLGGSDGDYEYGMAIVVDDSGSAYLTGHTDSTDFPTSNAYQDTFQGGKCDAYVTKLSSTGDSLVYSTYLGGSDTDRSKDLALDNSGHVYVAGYSKSTDFPTSNAFQDTLQGDSYDAFVTKLSSTGDSLVYSTYLGGSNYDFGYSIAVDNSGNAYLSGWTSSPDFPLQNPYQTDQGLIDVFVTKLSSTGNSLVYSTYLGGSDDDYSEAIALDSTGSAYVTGYTNGTDFPTLNSFQDDQGYLDIFVTKLSSGGNSISYSTYLGGNQEEDAAFAIAIDNFGNAYVTGYTESSDFPTPSGYDSSIALYLDVFVSKLSFSTGDDPAISSISPDSGLIGTEVTIYGSNFGATQGTVTFNGDNASISSWADTQIEATVPSTAKSGPVVVHTSEGEDSNEVTFIVEGPPEITVSQKALNFGATSAADKTPEQSFTISNSDGGVLDWTVTDDVSWLSCSPESGTGDTVITASVDPSGLSVGSYNATITVSSATASNSPQTVSVTLNVYAAGSDAVPFGSFDTPIHGSTVMSSVPVTGWALDDIGVNNLRIYRDPIAGEGDSQVYIGDAIFVEGARPDVESLYPNYPLNYQAGWGYMLLTNFLPDQGNGVFVLYAVAKDTSGHEVTLGSKTITCDNANAVKPFGAIDTPTQGGTASGSDYVNFGWALTPMANSIPTDGSTINVFVDGVNLGHPVYNNYRADIATLFPGYANSDGAVGFYTLDTTAYANGVHTIVWSVVDNVGNADGIGSRYFSIFNGSSGDAVQVQTSGRNVGFNPKIGFEKIKSIPPSLQPLKIKTGYNMETLPKDTYADEAGIFNVEIREVERLVISLTPYPIILNPEFSSLNPSTCYIGFTVVNGQLRPLPIGSTLNPRTGIFAWQPGPGFIGDYELVFVKGDASSTQQKVKIKVSIKPKFGVK